MSAVYFIVLLAICLGIVGWAVSVPRYILSAPFQVAGTCLFFVIPQLYVLQSRPDLVPAMGLDRYTLYAAICVLGCFIGYTMESRSQATSEPRFVHEPRLARLALLTSCAGVFGMIALHLYSTFIGIQGPWTGWPVYLYTLSKLVIPGLILYRLLYLVFRRRHYLMLSLVFVLPIVAQALGNGRRSWLFMLAFAWFFPMVLFGKIRIRRIYAIASLVAAFVIVVFLPAYRTQIRRHGYQMLPQIIAERPPAEVLRHYFSGDQTLEVRDSCVLMALIQRSGRHSFGARIYNGFVQQYFPGSLLGHELKRRIKLPVPQYLEAERELQRRHNYRGGSVKEYTSKTGFYDSYGEFWFLGSLLFFFLGRVCRFVEDRCFLQGDPRAILTLAFVGFVPAAIVYAEWNFALSVYLPSFVILYAAIKYAVGAQTEPSLGTAKWPRQLEPEPTALPIPVGKQGAVE